MDPHGPIARRFPLIARFRPACQPLPARVHSLIELADAAKTQGHQGLASTVYNQAALLASDLRLPDLARALCHQHAAAYLHACPLPAMSAIRALEPVVNLGRLQIRAGHTDDGRQRLLTLYEAVSEGTAAQLDGVTVPEHITASPEDRQEVRAWLWRVLLADGTRTLTTTGRWDEALAHLDKHRGVGNRMLDGRQVAVIAALCTGDTDRARALLESTTSGDPWEQTITACLTVLCRHETKQPFKTHLANLVKTYLARETEVGMTVFDIRLGLTALDAIGSVEDPAARDLVDDLHRRTIEAQDGYAARETLAHPLFTTLASDRQAQQHQALIHACALAAEIIPYEMHNELTTALHTSDSVIRTSLRVLHSRGSV